MQLITGQVLFRWGAFFSENYYFEMFCQKIRQIEGSYALLSLNVNKLSQIFLFSFFFIFEGFFLGKLLSNTCWDTVYTLNLCLKSST